METIEEENNTPHSLNRSFSFVSYNILQICCLLWCNDMLCFLRNPLNDDFCAFVFYLGKGRFQTVIHVGKNAKGVIKGAKYSTRWSYSVGIRCREIRNTYIYGGI